MTEYKTIHGLEKPEPMDDPAGKLDAPRLPELPSPINWNLLTADEAEPERPGLNQCLNCLRHTYGPAASVVPPLWHHHPEQIREPSALHRQRLRAHDPARNGCVPLGWQRRRNWVAARRQAEDRFYASLVLSTGDLP
jgi:hypothetical protein